MNSCEQEQAVKVVGIGDTGDGHMNLERRLIDERIPAGRWRATGLRKTKIRNLSMNLKLKTLAKLRTACQTFSIVLLVIVFSTGCQQSNARITDKNFEQALMDVLSQTDSPLTRSDLARFEELHLNDKDIENLNGIQLCTNLTYLSLTNNHLEDIRPLSSLTTLTDLRLNNTKIRNLEPLSEAGGTLKSRLRVLGVLLH